MSKSKKRLVYHSAQEAVSKRHSEANSWKVVSDELGGLNRGYLSKVARGSVRASDHLIGLINKAYGQNLPFNSKPATPCARCGSVHVTKRCTAAKSPRRYDGGVVRWNRVERPLMTALGIIHGAIFMTKLMHCHDCKMTGTPIPENNDTCGNCGSHNITVITSRYSVTLTR